MKNYLLLLALMAALMLTACKHTKSHHDNNDEEEEEQAMGLPIDEEHFPDDAFRAFLLEKEFGEDAIITEEEMEELYQLYIDDRGIRSLEGIEYLTSLSDLRISGNQFGNLFLPRMEGLYRLYLIDCGLTGLDLSQCPSISDFRCINNDGLTMLDLSNKPKLELLEVYENQLTTLNLKGSDSVLCIDVHQNQFTSLDLSAQRNLHYVNIGNNPMDEAQMDRFISQLPKGVQLDTSWSDHIEFEEPYISLGDRTLTEAQEQVLEQKGWEHRN